MSTLDDLRTLTVEGVAELLGVHAESVRRWIREGELVAARWGGRLRIAAGAVREFQERRAIRIAGPGQPRERPRTRKRHVKSPALFS